MRRLAAGLLWTATALALWVGAGSAQGAQVLLSPASSVVAPGGTVSVEVQVRDVVDLYGVDIHLAFDAARLEVQDADPIKAGVQIAPGDLLTAGPGYEAQNIADNIVGEVRYVFVPMTPAAPVSGSGAVARIAFRGRSPGESALTFVEVSLANHLADPIPAVASDGRIVVSGATATATATSTGSPTGFPTASATPTATRTGQVLQTVFLPIVLSNYTTPAPEPSPSLTPTSTPTATPHGGQLIVNPSFETDEAWEILQTVYPASYSQSRAHSGQRSIRLGIDAGPNLFSFCSVQQPVTIPEGAVQADLSLYYFPVSMQVDDDRIYFYVLSASDGSVLQIKLWTDLRQAWSQRTFDLRAFAGQRVILRFGVKNDGRGGVTAAYLDDVELLVAK